MLLSNEYSFNFFNFNLVFHKSILNIKILLYKGFINMIGIIGYPMSYLVNFFLLKRNSVILKLYIKDKPS